MTAQEIRDSELGTDYQPDHRKISGQVHTGVFNTYVGRRVHSPYNIRVLIVHIHTYNNNTDKSNNLIKLLMTLVNLSIALAFSVVLIVVSTSQGPALPQKH